MGRNSNEINENGETICISCRRKKFISEVELCILCDRFVCKSCATYLRQGDPFYGWVCKRCYRSIKNKSK